MCDYWGLNKQNFLFYDDNGEKIEILGGEAGGKSTVEHIMD
jgi:hypothetical protein